MVVQVNAYCFAVGVGISFLQYFHQLFVGYKISLYDRFFKDSGLVNVLKDRDEHFL